MADPRAAPEQAWPPDPLVAARGEQELQDALEGLLREATAAARAEISGPREGAGPVIATPGAAAVVVHRGEVVASAHAGVLASHDETGAVLAEPERVTERALWDIASITKVVVTLTTLVQHDAGVVDLDQPVSTVLPAFAAPSLGTPSGADARRGEVTLRHLLTHTAGLPAVVRLWDAPGDRREQAARVLAQPLESDPGAVHRYSCVGFMTLGLALEAATGRTLPELVTQAVTGPLGMTATGYRPRSGRPIAATEIQHDPPRGMVCGQVHDEAAWMLSGGPSSDGGGAVGGSGNAGIFSDACDLARLGEELRTGSLLTPASHEAMWRGVLGEAAVAEHGYNQGVGLRLGQRSVMGTGDPGVGGHTGFTGTLVVADRAREVTVVVLTNRVHPRRERFGVDALRRAVVDLARGWAR